MKIETQILGVNYTIYISEDKLRKACEENNLNAEDTQGLHVWWNREIYVSDLLEPWQLAQTLIHELIHAIGNITGHSELAHSTRKNEYFVNAIANGIVSALTNPELFMLLGSSLGVIQKAEEGNNG